MNVLKEAKNKQTFIPSPQKKGNHAIPIPTLKPQAPFLMATETISFLFVQEA